jgi:hypothetical protein
MKTTAFMDVIDNRNRISFGADTPDGVWYDSIYTPKRLAYCSAYRLWANPATCTRMAVDSIKPLGILVLSVTFRNRDTGSSVKPYYLNGAVICYGVSDTPVVDRETLPYARLATRSPFKPAFDPCRHGRTVCPAARRQNRRGEVGPWSEIIPAIVP